MDGIKPNTLKIYIIIDWNEITKVSMVAQMAEQATQGWKVPGSIPAWIQWDRVYNNVDSTSTMSWKDRL